jgi:tetratricopeptide (TPR) repeat protein
MPYIMLAGDHAEAVFAHTEALQHFGTALELAQDVGDRRREAEALEKRGVVLRLVAPLEEALDVFERAASIWQELDDPECEARVTGERVGSIYYHLGRSEDGIARIEPMLRRLESEVAGPHLRRPLADLYIAKAMNLWGLARYEETRVAAGRAVELTRATDYMRRRGLAETFHGMALTMVASLPEARRVLEEATRLFPRSENTWWMANALGNLGRTYLDEGNARAARGI